MNFEGLKINSRLFFIRLLSALFFISLIIFAIWPWINGASKHKRTIVVYGFSILGEVMNDGIFPAFSKLWETRTGEKVEFISSFGGSGAITNQIIMGVPAEIAILSLELDAYRLSENNIIREDSWRELPYHGVLNLTPFILLVRPGNPKKINDFPDLTKKGINIVHPDPLTSGGAQWAILAEYGSASLNKNNMEAYKQLKGIWINVTSQAASARAARTQFNNGFGDVLITYEQEALIDKMKKRLDAEIVYPQSTILSEHTVVEIEKNISAEQRELVKSFVNYLWSKDAQRIFVRYGFRSVDQNLNKVPHFVSIEKLFKVNDLGGWKHAKKTIIDSIWISRVLEEIRE